MSDDLTSDDLSQPPFLTGVPEEIVGDSYSDDHLVEYGFEAGMKWQEWHDQARITELEAEVERLETKSMADREWALDWQRRVIEESGSRAKAERELAAAEKNRDIAWATFDDEHEELEAAIGRSMAAESKLALAENTILDAIAQTKRGNVATPPWVIDVLVGYIHAKTAL